MSTTILLGEPEIEPSTLQKAFENLGVMVSVKHPAHLGDEIHWLRDYSLCLPPFGIHLIPNTLNFCEKQRFELLTPVYSNDRQHCIDSRSLGHGTDSKREHAFFLHSYLKENKPFYRNSPCVLEGGNVLFFYDAEGKSRVMIGFNSVVATFVSLLSQNFFTLHQFNIPFFIEPSDEAYYAARNFYYCENELPICAIFTPLSYWQKASVYSKAVQIEKCYQIVKKLISEDVGINDPIFVPQGDFHIDMSLLPLNGKNVVLYHKEDNPLLKPYHEKIESVLHSHGLIPKGVIALAKRDSEKVNLMNVLQIGSGMVIPTTPPEFKDVDDQFMRILKDEGVKVARIDLPRDTITELHGGLHCFTTEFITFSQ